MIQVLMAIFDTKARAFSQPFTVGHVDLGCRAFAEAVNGPQTNQVAKYPEDHLLMHIGNFDDNTGLVESINPPLNLGSGLNYKKKGA